MSRALLDAVIDHFTELDDPRRRTANCRHEFVDTLMVALCAMIGEVNRRSTVVTSGRAK